MSTAEETLNALKQEIQSLKEKIEAVAPSGPSEKGEGPAEVLRELESRLMSGSRNPLQLALLALASGILIEAEPTLDEWWSAFLKRKDAWTEGVSGLEKIVEEWFHERRGLGRNLRELAGEHPWGGAAAALALGFLVSRILSSKEL